MTIYAIMADVQLISGAELSVVDYLEAGTSRAALNAAQNYFLAAPKGNAVLWGLEGSTLIMADTVVSVTFTCIGALDMANSYNKNIIDYVRQNAASIDELARGADDGS